jgi:hypothetical protein
MPATRRREAGEAPAQRLNVRLSIDAYRCLGVHAIMAGVTPGRLVERLIEEHLREWSVQAEIGPVAPEKLVV